MALYPDHLTPHSIEKRERLVGPYGPEEVAVTILHECGHICPRCNGSGEGMTDGSHCTECPRSGGWIGRGEIETTEFVEFEKGVLVTPAVPCDACDLDLLPIIVETIKEHPDKVQKA